MAEGRTGDRWDLRGRSISLRDPIVMGILNVTPDSFSDGGLHDSVTSGLAAGVQMIHDGATIIDVGGESTRPGATPISVDDERARVIPIIEQLSREGGIISVDTSKPEVARAAIEAGAVIVNDVTGLEDPRMRSLCADSGVGVVIMHSRGTPQTMQIDPHYDDVVIEVTDYLMNQAESAQDAGMSSSSIVIDPGIGFGKTYDHNIELLSRIDVLAETGYPVMIGASRKGFLGTILEPFRGTTAPAERDGATAATTALAIVRGARIIRVHNVPLAVDVAVTAKAMVPLEHGEETNGT